MKSVKNVFDKIHNKEHIKDVLMQSLKGKKYAKRHKEHIDELVDYTYEHMEFQNYDLKPKTKMIIHDRKKDREITKSPYFPNKMYDYMIVSGIKETLEKSMYKWSVGNIKGRGKDMGISYLEKHIRGYKYALKLDIKKFYDNIDLSILFKQISKKFSDRKFLNFFAAVVGNTGKGLDLGLNSSQWLSNFYLQGLDYFIKQKLKAEVYVRYVDDMIILGNNKRKLHYYIRMIQDYLKTNLRLRLKENYQLLNLEKGDEIEFLGYKVRKERTTLVKPIFYKFVRLYKRMVDKSKRRAKTVVSLYGWFKRSSYSYMYYKKYLEPIISFKNIKLLLRKRSA